MIRRRFVRTAVAVTALAFATACASSTQVTAATPSATASPQSPVEVTPVEVTPVEVTPVEVTQCDQQTKLPAPATRAVTLNQHATELVLAMGLGDRLIGTSLLDSPVRPDLKAAYDKVPVLTESSYPSKEALLGLHPDLLIGGFGGTFLNQANNLPPDQFEAAGIGLFTVQCRGVTLTTDTTMDTIDKLGTLFGAPEAAARLKATITAQFDAVKAQVQSKAPVDMMIYDIFGTAPQAVGSRGMENAIATLAGGRNVFGDLDKQYAEVSLEEIVKRNPAVIVVLDYSPKLVDTASPKIAALKADPALKNVRAVRDNRFVALPLTGMGAVSPRNGEVAQQLADVLHPRS